jgi:hypothetical protein
MPTHNSNCKKKTKKRKELYRYSNPQPSAWLADALTTTPSQHALSEVSDEPTTSI